MKVLPSFYARQLLPFLVLVVFWVTACTPAAQPPTPTAAPPKDVTLKFIGVPNGVGYEMDYQLITQFTQQTGIKVEVIPGPEQATDRIALYQDIIEKDASDVDVYQIDVIWPGILSEHLLDLTPYLEKEAAGHLPAIIQNNTVNDKLVGMPFFTDVGLLYYRPDLLEKYEFSQPPKTWEELEEMARVIQEGERAAGNPGFWGYVWHGRANEGLTCVGLEWQVSFGAGPILNQDGTPAVNNIETILALEMAAGWVNTISPPQLLDGGAEDVRAIWHAGNAAFMRNWPYAYANSQKDDSAVKDNFAITVLPSGGARHAGTLGGWQLGVSKYTNHPEEAMQFVAYMTSAEVQKQRAIQGAYLPTRPELYADPDVLAANPFYAQLQEVFLTGGVARPSGIAGAKYNELSIAYATAVHAVLSGQKPAGEAMTELETTLTELLKPQD